MQSVALCAAGASRPSHVSQVSPSPNAILFWRPRGAGPAVNGPARYLGRLRITQRRYSTLIMIPAGPCTSRRPCCARAHARARGERDARCTARARGVSFERHLLGHVRELFEPTPRCAFVPELNPSRRGASHRRLYVLPTEMIRNIESNKSLYLVASTFPNGDARAAAAGVTGATRERERERAAYCDQGLQFVDPRRNWVTRPAPAPRAPLRRRRAPQITV
ncbi:hypothetical protein EVAR_51634_1 [Eumeta japonica]|uniref:Uncharacterized protein n=1 Tax=Eumeta variegata TaxID=151549 RepID=A0A4C1YDQ5_EUMVA|nr:hypothetical protein EVAR_51634_1 [Eumeta japonica]